MAPPFGRMVPDGVWNGAQWHPIVDILSTNGAQWPPLVPLDPNGVHLTELEVKWRPHLAGWVFYRKPSSQMGTPMAKTFGDHWQPLAKNEFVRWGNQWLPRAIGKTNG